MLSASDPNRPPAGWRRSLLSWGGTATAAMALYLVSGGRQPGLALHLYLAAMGTIVVVMLAARSLAGYRIEGDGGATGLLGRGRRRSRPERLRPLEELERALDFSLSTAFDVHYRLRPHLVLIAGHRLSVRGVNLELQPERARELLGDQLWQLVRPDREPPSDRNGKGLSPPELRGLVESLERV